MRTTCRPLGAPGLVLTLTCGIDPGDRKVIRAVARREISYCDHPVFAEQPVMSMRCPITSKARGDALRYIHCLRRELARVVEDIRPHCDESSPRRLNSTALRRLIDPGRAMFLAEHELVLAFDRLTTHVVNRVAKRYHAPADELQAAAAPILYDAIDRYDTRQNTYFSTLLYQRLFWLLPRAADKYNGRLLPLDEHDATSEQGHDDSGEIPRLLDIAGLSELQRAAVVRLYGVGDAEAVPPDTLFKQLGLATRSALDRELAAAMALLRAAAER